jgi:hypothetical protein
VTGGHGLMYMFTYHAQRPLQIESLLATPFAIGHAFGLLHFDASSTFGSQGIPGEGAHLAATISPWLTLLTVGLVYLFIWRRRHYLRAVPAAVPLAALALVLAFVCTSKVLSPQFMIWTFPLVALVTVGRGRGQRTLGALCLLAMLLTQVEFPAYYWSFVAFHRVPVMIVTLRNITLLAAGVLAAVLVWRLPAVAGLGAREAGAIGRAGFIDYDAPARETAPRPNAPALTHSQPEET